MKTAGNTVTEIVPGVSPVLVSMLSRYAWKDMG